MSAILRAALSALHFLALAIGFTGLYVRGLKLRELRKAAGNAKVRSTLLRADDARGVAAVLWIVTGFSSARNT